MRRLTRGGLVASVVALAASLGIAPPSAAHSDQNFIGERWTTDASVHFYWDDGVRPGSRFRDRVEESFATWSNLDGGRGPYFVVGSTDSQPWQGLNACDYNNNKIYERNIDDRQQLAFEIGCATSRRSDSTLIKRRSVLVIDNDALGSGWWTQTTRPSQGTWDLRSIITHEVGHVVGFTRGDDQAGHFSLSRAICANVGENLHTMCQGRSGVRGTRYIRTLEPHDLHTAENGY